MIGLALFQYYSLAGVGTSFASVVIGNVVVTTPYATRLVMASLTGVDHAIEWAAQTLGASKAGAFVRVTPSVIRDRMASGATFTFIMSFENVTVSAFLSTPRTLTFPVRIFSYWDKVIQPWLIALASMVIVGTFIVLFVFDRIVSVRGLYGRKSGSDRGDHARAPMFHRLSKRGCGVVRTSACCASFLGSGKANAPRGRVGTAQRSRHLTESGAQKKFRRGSDHHPTTCRVRCLSRLGASGSMGTSSGCAHMPGEQYAGLGGPGLRRHRCPSTLVGSNRASSADRTLDAEPGRHQ